MDHSQTRSEHFQRHRSTSIQQGKLRSVRHVLWVDACHTRRCWISYGCGGKNTAYYRCVAYVHPAPFLTSCSIIFHFVMPCRTLSCCPLIYRILLHFTHLSSAICISLIHSSYLCSPNLFSYPHIISPNFTLFYVCLYRPLWWCALSASLQDSTLHDAQLRWD